MIKSDNRLSSLTCLTLFMAHKTDSLLIVGSLIISPPSRKSHTQGRAPIEKCTTCELWGDIPPAGIPNAGGRPPGGPIGGFSPVYPFVVKGFCVASCILATIWSTPDMAGGSMGPMPAYLLYRSPEMSPHCCAMLIRFMACKEKRMIP